MNKPPKTDGARILEFRRMLVPSLRELAKDELRNAVIRLALDTLSTRELRQVAERLHRGALK